MKNALVIEHHLGDSGNVTEGMILVDISDKRFEALKRRGLVREATAEEVRAGDQHVFERDTSGENARALPVTLTATEFMEAAGKVRDEFERRLADLNEEHAQELKAATDRAEAAEQALDEARGDAEQIGNDLTVANDRIGVLEQQLVEARDAALQASDGEAKGAADPSNKKAAEPANKKAADPANKGA